MYRIIKKTIEQSVIEPILDEKWKAFKHRNEVDIDFTSAPSVPRYFLTGHKSVLSFFAEWKHAINTFVKSHLPVGRHKQEDENLNEIFNVS